MIINYFKKFVFFIIILFIFNINIFAITEAPIDITNVSIKELNEYLDLGIITSEQLVNLYLDRINTYNNDFKAIIFFNDNVINEAKQLDKERENGKIRGSLHGIPIVVKNNIDIKGIPTTAGSKALSDNIPSENAVVVQKLIDEGAIIIGSTNMSQYAFSAKTTISNYGTTKNSYNLKYSTYGSSGGTAVAVSLSFAASGLGTDTNASIRVPSSANNVVGMRSTYNYLSTKGIIPYDVYRDVVGPISKNVYDTSLLLSIMNDDNKDYTKNITNNLKEKTIGIINDYYIGNKNSSIKQNTITYSKITELMKLKIKEFENLGAKIVYIDTLMTYKYDNLNTKTTTGWTFCQGFNDYIKSSNSNIKNFDDLTNSKYNQADLSGYQNSCNRTANLEELNGYKNEYKNYINKIFSDNNLDVIAYPTTKNKLSTLYGDDLIATSSNLVSAIGYPAISIPLGFDDEHLPYGIEFLAPANKEDILIEITSAIPYKINNSTLAPNLYEIDNEVTMLVTNYQKFNNKNKKIVNEIKEYFKNYNNIKNKKETAIKLNKKITNYKFKNIYIAIPLLIILFVILRRKKEH